jgi:hypothetical protein
MLGGCGQAHVDIQSTPPNVSKTQAQLDDLQCAAQSEYTGPWLFHWLFYYSHKNTYRTCLEKKGYTVKN